MLLRVIAALPAASPWLKLKTGLLCVRDLRTFTWTGGRISQDLPPYAAAFKAELERAGFKVVTPGEDNLFDPEAVSSDYQAAAVITDEQVDGCMAPGGAFSPDRGDVRGSASMKIDWQLYAPIKKQVVAHISTGGTTKLDDSVAGGVTRLITEAFAANVRELAANAEFRAAMRAPKAFTKGFLVPGQQSKIALAGSLKAPLQHIDDAGGSVVTITTGFGTGSGLLISDDGYVLTNAHVVGEEKTLRVRWSDGIETLAQVVRVAKDRDVAVIKTDPRDRTPLSLSGARSDGQKVFAIGTPKSAKLQGTVSSGVISANRIFDGMRFIQSDTSVSPGSSGGPLLDESGAVIAITVAGIENEGRAGLESVHSHRRRHGLPVPGTALISAGN